jgi:hypothetical protein
MTSWSQGNGFAAAPAPPLRSQDSTMLYYLKIVATYFEFGFKIDVAFVLDKSG